MMIPFSFFADNKLLLDIHSGAAIALGLRKLRSAYTGSCIRVRRSSDNSEQNIGFSGSALDTTTLLSFVGAGTGYIVTWYDQSGNGLNMGQSTAGSQPVIVNAGSLITKNSRASIDFSGGTKFLTRSALSALNSGNNFTWFNIAAPNTTETIGVVWDTNNTGGGGALNSRVVTYCDSRTTPTRNMIIVDSTAGTNYNFDLSTARVNTDLRLTSGVVIGSGSKTGSAWDNGSAGGSGAWANSYTNNSFNIGVQLAVSLPLDGKVAGVIIYPSDKSSTRSSIEENIKRYFGIA